MSDKRKKFDQLFIGGEQPKIEQPQSVTYRVKCPIEELDTGAVCFPLFGEPDDRLMLHIHPTAESAHAESQKRIRDMIGHH